MAQNNVTALLHGPGLQPPPGVVPNFIDPPSQAQWVYVTLPICLAVSTPFVWIRLYSVFFILKSHGWADYTAVLAWAFLVAYVASVYVVVQYGGGVHQWDVPLIRVIEFAKLAYIPEVLYCPSIFIAKLSILLMFRRLFDTARVGKTHYLIQILIWANLTFYFPYCLATVIQCVPHARIWDRTIKGGCIDLLAAFIAASAINVVSDFSILLLPLYLISKLKIPTRRKIGVLAIFAVGLFTCITSIMRLVVSSNTGRPDKTYYLQPPALWSAAELASAILAGCMPATAAFFNHVYPKLVRKFINGPSNPPCIFEQKGEAGGMGKGAVPARSSWRAPRVWDESYLLRTGGSEGEGIVRGQVSGCSDEEEAREKVEAHLRWSGWRR